MDFIREAECDAASAPRAVAVNREAAYWVTPSATLWLWPAAEDSEPVAAADLSVQGDVQFMVVADDDNRFLLVTSSQLLCFALTRTAAVRLPQVFDDLEELEELEEFEEEPEDSLEAVAQDVQYVFAASLSCVGPRGGVRHVSISPDGDLAVLACDEGLVLVNCQYSVPSDDNGRCVMVNCLEWYGAERGCALACLSSAERLFALSPKNHLVCALVSAERRTVQLWRDGHILTRAHHVLCLSCGNPNTGLVAAGLSDGSLQLIHADNLQLLQRIDVVNHLERLLGVGAATALVGPENAKTPWRAVKGNRVQDKRASAGRRGTPNYGAVDTPSATGAHGSALKETNGVFLEGLVLAVAIGETDVTVATPDAVVSLHRESLALSPEHTYFFDHDLQACFLDLRNNSQLAPHPLPPQRSDLMPPEVTIAPCGSWVSRAALQSQSILYRVSKSGASDDDVGGNSPNGNDGEDLIHAHLPLPGKWLESLVPDDALAASPYGANDKNSRRRLPASSGYAKDVPWSVQQKQKQRKAQAQKKGDRRVRVDGGVGFGGASRPQYEQSGEPYRTHPLQPMSSANRVLREGRYHTGSVTEATFSRLGEHLLTVSAGGSAHSLRYPPAKYKGAGTSLSSGGGASLPAALRTVDVNLSSQDPLVVTGSAAGMVQLWRPTKKEIPLAELSVGDRKSEVSRVRFFYMDKLLALSCRSNLQLHRYAATAIAERPVFSHVIRGHAITAFECLNSFTSCLAVAASSDKSISLVDVAAQRTVREWEDAHARAIHHLAMCRAGHFANPGLAALHTFFSAGMDGAVRMWDLRMSAPARQFSLHRNTAVPSVALAVSPTGSMIAVGSEDQRLIVYDSRDVSAPLDELELPATPTAAAWHPVHRVLALGLVNGDLCLYGQK